MSLEELKLSQAKYLTLLDDNKTREKEICRELNKINQSIIDLLKLEHNKFFSIVAKRDFAKHVQCSQIGVFSTFEKADESVTLACKNISSSHAPDYEIIVTKITDKNSHELLGLDQQPYFEPYYDPRD
jgi:hypothetical protein